jgi:hypothetical protein
MRSDPDHRPLSRTRARKATVRGLPGSLRDVLTHPEFVLGVLGLLLLLAAGWIAVVWIRRWRQQPDESDAPGEELAQFRALQMQGELSEEELERIRQRLEAPSSADKQDPSSSQSVE